MSKSIEDSVSSLTSEISRLKESLSVDTESTESKLSRLADILQSQTYFRNDVKSLSDVPGLKKPQWYVVDLPFDYGATDEVSRLVNMSADNAFVCTQMQTYFLVQDDDEEHYSVDQFGLNFQSKGRLLPTSSYYPYVSASKVSSRPLFETFGSKTFPLSFERGNGFVYPEFEFKLEIEGTGRYWASTKLPAAALQGVKEPFYLGFEGVVENSDKIRVYAYPTTTVNLKGVVRFVMHGYSIGSKVSVRDQLGY